MSEQTKQIELPNDFLTLSDVEAMKAEIESQMKDAGEWLRDKVICYNGEPFPQRPVEDHFGMAQMCLKDAARLTEIMEAIFKGKFKEAARLAQDQDTAAREHVPSCIWEKLEQHM